MIILDTDTMTHFFMNHPKVVHKFRATKDEVVITIISRIETLQGRFATLLKAMDHESLKRGQLRLDQAEQNLAVFRVLPIDAAAATEFEQLQGNKRLRKIGRADLLIAAIALGNRATLATRNLKHFRLEPTLKVENWVD